MLFGMLSKKYMMVLLAGTILEVLLGSNVKQTLQNQAERRTVTYRKALEIIRTILNENCK